MPVNMGELVAEEFVIDLLGPIDLGENLGDTADVLHQQNPFRGGQMKQLCLMAFENDNDPAGEELIVMQIDFGEVEVGDEMGFLGPAALASLTARIHHSQSTLCHSLDRRVTLTSACFVSSGRSIAESETFIERGLVARLDTSFRRTIFSFKSIRSLFTSDIPTYDAICPHTCPAAGFRGTPFPAHASLRLPTSCLSWQDDSRVRSAPCGEDRSYVRIGGSGAGSWT